MRRRTLLLSGVGAIVAAGLGAVALLPKGIQATTVATLRRRLGYLQLDESGLQEFARAHAAKLLARRMTSQRVKYHLAMMFNHRPWLEFAYPAPPRRSKVEHAEDVLVSTYLMSSDFFANGANEARPVKFVRYYDAMVPCGNPFARPAVS